MDHIPEQNVMKNNFKCLHDALKSAERRAFPSLYIHFCNNLLRTSPSTGHDVRECDRQGQQTKLHPKGLPATPGRRQSILQFQDRNKKQIHLWRVASDDRRFASCAHPRIVAAKNLGRCCANLTNIEKRKHVGDAINPHEEIETLSVVACSYRLKTPLRHTLEVETPRKTIVETFGITPYEMKRWKIGHFVIPEHVSGVIATGMRSKPAVESNPIHNKYAQSHTALPGLPLKTSESTSGIVANPRKFLIVSEFDEDNCGWITVLDSRAGYEGLFGITLFEALYKNMNYGWGIRQSGHYLIIGLAYGRLPKNLKREMGSTSPFSIPLDHFGLAHATGSGRIESPDSIEPRKL